MPRGVNFMHWHLMLSHFPAIALILGAGLVQRGARLGDAATQRSALWILALGGASAAAAAATGEAAADLAGAMPGWHEMMIERHRRAALAAAAASVLVGAGAAWLLWADRALPAPRRRGLRAVEASALACFILLGWASWRGGQIRHSEIQPDWKEWRVQP